MGSKDEGENHIGKNPISLELETIYRLNPETVVLGLSHLIDEVRLPLLNKIIKGSLPEIEQERLMALNAISSLLEPPAYIYGQGDYKKDIERVLKYMRFLRFPESDLGAQGILAAEDRLNLQIDPERELKESKIVDFQLIQSSRQVENRSSNAATKEQLKASPEYQLLKKHNEYLRKKVKSLETQLDELLGIDTKSEDAAYLEFLDYLIEISARFPDKATDKATFDKAFRRYKNLYTAVMATIKKPDKSKPKTSNNT